MPVTREELDQLESVFRVKHDDDGKRSQRRRTKPERPDLEDGQPNSAHARHHRPERQGRTGQETPVTQVIKEERPMSTETRQAHEPAAPRPAMPFGIQPQQEMESCPLCGYRKPTEITVQGGVKVRPLVCKGCSDRYHQYGAEIAIQLAKGETVEILTRHQWILAQLDLSAFEQELEAAAAEKNRLNEEVQAQLRTLGHLPREVFVPLRDRLQEQTGARAAYGKFRRLEERLKAARVVRPELEQMVSHEAARPVATEVEKANNEAAGEESKPTARRPRSSRARES